MEGSDSRETPRWTASDLVGHSLGASILLNTIPREVEERVADIPSAPPWGSRMGSQRVRVAADLSRSSPKSADVLYHSASEWVPFATCALREKLRGRRSRVCDRGHQFDDDLSESLGTSKGSEGESHGKNALERWHYDRFRPLGRDRRSSWWAVRSATGDDDRPPRSCEAFTVFNQTAGAVVMGDTALPSGER